jgi:hypothetical protein
MKKIFLILSVVFAVSACTKEDFEESYADPSKVARTSVEKQFAGFLAANSEYVIPSYWNYFVVLRPTVNRYTQATGWVNGTGQYVPGGGLITDRWNNYYLFLSQYRELESIYSRLSTAEQAERRIFMIAATIYLYDHTQKVIDLHGDIPFTQAGKLSTNGGDYEKSMASYDDAQTLYTKMLDELKLLADELNTITVSTGILTGFKTQDFINNGDLNKWKIYCNSLRLRMLTRVSGASTFQSRSNTEIASILNNPGSYPVITDNAENIQIKVFSVETNRTINLNSAGFRTGLEDWNGNLAGKAMIDQMVSTADPRLRVMFEPGANAAGAYKGLDPLLPSGDQQTQVDAGTMSIYNRSTLSRNQYFPGVLINAAEVYFLKAEYYVKAGNDSEARNAYNKGIDQSVKQYYLFRQVSNDNTAGSVNPANDAEIQAYQNAPLVSWNAATSPEAKMKLIATQKWLHYSVVQPLESWAELRRLDQLDLKFEVDNTNNQKQPPVRWLYANSENVYNTQNYNAVRAKDNLTTKLFWDVQ